MTVGTRHAEIVKSAFFVSFIICFIICSVDLSFPHSNLSLRELSELIVIFGRFNLIHWPRQFPRTAIHLVSHLTGPCHGQRLVRRLHARFCVRGHFRVPGHCSYLIFNFFLSLNKEGNAIFLFAGSGSTVSFFPEFLSSRTNLCPLFLRHCSFVFTERTEPCADGSPIRVFIKFTFLFSTFTALCVKIDAILPNSTFSFYHCSFYFLIFLNSVYTASNVSFLECFSGRPLYAQSSFPTKLLKST